VVLEALVADVAEEFLQLWHMSDRAVAKGLERIVGELAFADVGADDAAGVVGRQAAKGERAGGRAAVERAPSVFNAERRSRG